MVLSKLSKTSLLFVLALFLISPVIAACDNVTIVATEPQNLNYTYSVNIPLEWVAVNATSCWVYIDSEKYQNNLTLDCSVTSTMTDLDYNGNYTANYWVSNATAFNECNTTLAFVIDRSSEFEDNKPALSGIFIIALICIGGFTVYLSKYLSDNFKALILAMSVLFVYMSLSIMVILAKEYIKVPTIISNLERMLTVTIWASTAIAMLLLLLFIANIMRKAQIWKENKEAL